MEDYDMTTPDEPPSEKAKAAHCHRVEPEQMSDLESKIVVALRKVFDPEIPVNIYDIGLIYDIILDAENNADIKMTLTAPNCPAAQTLPAEAETQAKAVDGVASAKVEIIWEPTWGMEMMSDDARLSLGF